MVNPLKPRGGRNLGSGGSSSVGAISYDANAIKAAFFSKCSARQAQRISGDGGYWTGGRCDWGAGHNLDEDVQKLVGTFNKVAGMNNAIQALKDCSSSEQFLAHKNALLAKCNQAIAEMNIGAIENQVGYHSGLCIIWTDYTGTFLNPYIIAFTNDLHSQMSEINGLNYEALVELEKLQLDEQKIKGEIEEAYRQAEEAKRKGDTVKVAELYQIIKNLKVKHDEVVNQIMANPWNKANNYDYSKNINQLIAILEGKANPNSSPSPNKEPNPNVPDQNPTDPNGSSKLPNYPKGINNPWQPNQPSQNASLDQQTMLIIVGMALVVVFLLMNQKETHSRHKYDEYDY